MKDGVGKGWWGGGGGGGGGWTDVWRYCSDLNNILYGMK